EEDDLTVGLTAELEADRHLLHGRIADIPSSFVHLALAVRTPDTDPALSDRRENRISVCCLEEVAALDGFLENIDRVLILVRPRWRHGQRHRQQREDLNETTLDHGVSLFWWICRVPAANGYS